MVKLKSERVEDDVMWQISVSAIMHTSPPGLRRSQRTIWKLGRPDKRQLSGKVGFSQVSVMNVRAGEWERMR